MIRVAVVDDHYAVRLGLEAALRAQPDMIPVGAAASAAELAPMLYRTTPDVLLVDYRLPDDDGLAICLRLEAEVSSPALIVHSAFADDWLTVPALIAGADGIVHKGASGQQLAEAIRTVADGRSALPEIARTSSPPPPRRSTRTTSRSSACSSMPSPNRRSAACSASRRRNCARAAPGCSRRCVHPPPPTDGHQRPFNRPAP
jgi:DNA-binding NarL/FixJ family response regulator